MPSEVSVTPSCMAAMKRGGRETILSTCCARRSPCLLELDDLRPARRHEAVLGRDEKRVQEQQPGDGGQLEEDRHAPVSPEAQVLGGSSSSKLARSIGNHPDVLAPFRPLLDHEALQMRSVSATAKRREAGLIGAEEVERSRSRCAARPSERLR